MVHFVHFSVFHVIVVINILGDLGVTVPRLAVVKTEVTSLENDSCMTLMGNYLAVVVNVPINHASIVDWGTDSQRHLEQKAMDVNDEVSISIVVMNFRTN